MRMRTIVNAETMVFHSLSVFEMSFDDPAILKKCVRPLVVSQVDTFTGVSDDIARTRILSGPIAHQFLKVRDVVRSNFTMPSSVIRVSSNASVCLLTSFRVRQRHRNTLGNADLVQLQVRITRDDRTRREVDTLAHQIAT